MKMTKVDGHAEDRRRRHRHRHPLRVRLQGRRLRDRDQPSAEGRRARQPSTARRTSRSTRHRAHEDRADREGLRAERQGVGSANRRTPNRERADVAFHAPRVGDVPAVDRRQHGRRLDALGARAVRVQPDARSTTPTSAPASCGRSSTRSSSPTRIRARSSTATTPARSVPSIAAASARPASSSLKQFVADGGTLITLGNACDLAIEKLPIPVRNLKKGLTPRSALRARRHPQARGRHAASDRLRRGRRHLRLLHQQPVLPADRRLQLAAAERRRALSEHRTSSPRAG